MPVITGSSEPKWWRASWVKWTAMIIFLIGGFYGVSDLLGAMAWLQAQKEIAAAGESLDPKKFIPPEVPEEQNFGALPVFKLEPDYSNENYPGVPEAFALDRALQAVSNIPSSKEAAFDKRTLPFLGSDHKGEAPDLPSIHSRMAELAHQHSSTSLSSLELYSLLCPLLADLRQRNESRPVCRYNFDYDWRGPQEIFASSIFGEKMSPVLAYEERLALLFHRPDLAWQDIKIADKMSSGLRQEPFSFSAQEASDLTLRQFQSFQMGIHSHLWSDQQLSEMDREWGEIDYLKSADICLRGDLLFGIVPALDHFKAERLEFCDRLSETSDWFSPGTGKRELERALFCLIPSGWFEFLKSDFVRFSVIEATKIVDPKHHQIYPLRQKDFDRLIANSVFVKYNALEIPLGPQFIPDNIRVMGYNQVQVDEARLACRLERYRLGHGFYPEKLEMLEVLFGANPRDVIGGQQYRYRSSADKNYLLYSVGWNERDDGGDGTAPQHLSSQDASDWVWTNVPARE